MQSISLRGNPAAVLEGGVVLKHWIRSVGTAAVILALFAGAWAASALTVQVSSTRMRKDAKFWAPSVETLTAGAKLSEVSRSGDWIRVKSPSGKTGWVHESAVTSRKVTLGTGSKIAAAGASSDEIALAGKGFNEQVEGEYKKANRSLDFEGVDRVSRITVSDDEVIQFLKEGRLADWGRGS